MSTDHKVCIRDEYGVFDSWEAWQKFHRDRKDIDRLSEYAKALKEENKRLREALRNVTDDAECAFGVLIDLGNGCTHPMETIEAFADELEKSLSTANKLLLKEE